MKSDDPLQFRDRKAYSDRLTETQSKTGLVDAVQTGFGQLDNLAVALGVMDFRFMGGSMGSVVGKNSPARKAVSVISSVLWRC